MITIDIKSALIYFLYFVLIILVVYLILFVRNLIVTIKRTNKVLQDTAVISKIASNRATELDGAIGNIKEATADIAKAVKGQQNLVGAVSNIVKAFGSLAAIFRNETEEDNNNKKKSK